MQLSEPLNRANLKAYAAVRGSDRASRLTLAGIGDRMPGGTLTDKTLANRRPANTWRSDDVRRMELAESLALAMLARRPRR